MQERVQKILSAYGIASRRKAEEWINQGRVTVNGVPCALGDKADPETDTILVDGNPLIASPEKVYIMLNKPRGYVTTVQDERNRKTVMDLVEDCGERIYPVGRLDMDSEGLLLLTNDGTLTNSLLHPSFEAQKVYRVWVSGYSEQGQRSMGEPMELDGYRIRPAQVRKIWQNGEEALLEVKIHEGRNRQVRKMAEICGMKVKRLRRIQEGPLSLGELAPGQWRYLTGEEIAALQNLHEKN